MVGQGIHRMDECFTGQTALQKSLSASRSFRWESTSTLYKLYDYTEAVDAMEKNAADRARIPCLLVSWDNSPVAPRRVSFSKTAIHSHSGEFWSGDCEIGRRLHRYPICFSQWLERVGGRQPLGARPEVRGWLSGRITPRPQSCGRGIQLAKNPGQRPLTCFLSSCLRYDFS